jgi:hypothetical protein
VEKNIKEQKFIFLPVPKAAHDFELGNSLNLTRVYHNII